MLKDEARHQNAIYKEEEPLDELVLMSTNQMAGPPVTDSAELTFSDGADNLDGSSLFAPPHSGLGDVGDQGFLSLLAGDMGHMPEHLTSSSLVLDAATGGDGGAVPSQPTTGTISSSNQVLPSVKDEGVPPLSSTLQGGVPYQGVPDARDLAIERDFLGELDEIAAQELTRISSSAASSAGPTANAKKSSNKKKNTGPSAQPLHERHVMAGIRNDETKASGASTARSAATSSRGIEKASSESLSLLDDDKENGNNEHKPTRLRYSKGAAPSKYCHVCGRSAKTVSVALCGNNKLGLCRKVVCDKCLIMHQWGDFRSAKESESSWICTHCRGDCPARARCHQYQRNNMRRRLKSSATANQRAAALAGIGGMPRGVAGGGPPIGKAMAGVAHDAGRTGGLMGRRGAPLMGGKMVQDQRQTGKATGAVVDLTPTNIMGASTAFGPAPVGRPPVGAAPGGSSLYSCFDVLE